MYRHRLSEELPCAGDWVCVEKNRDDDAGLIRTVLIQAPSLPTLTRYHAYASFTLCNFKPLESAWPIPILLPS